MKKDLQLTDLIYSESFQSWVKEGKDAALWEKYVQEHPEKQAEIQHARKIVQTLSFKSDRFERSEALLTRIHQSIAQVDSSKTHIHTFKSQHWLNRFVKYAAILILALGIGYILYQQPPRQEEIKAPAWVWKSLDVPAGQLKTIKLPDGSTVKVNAESQLKFTEPFQPRTIYLEGEAYFDVHSDSLHPFTVITKSINTLVTGTQFNVNTRNQQTRIALVEGKVQVKDTLHNVQFSLNPGQQATLTDHQADYKISTFHQENVTGWKDYIFICQSEKLQSIFQDLERIYGVKFTIRPGINLQQTYSGRFENKTLEYILEGISYSADFQFSIKNKTVTIFP
ncbi:FecR family protein [Rapidithrix thailandica]|uniref:FecR family protein n=1 Tax=Rapidithrix thailandica TaxID=413964 RepID=A0AAW9RXE1_9BACT